MTTWGMDTGHCTVEDFLDVYEGRKTLEDLCLEKLGHGLAHCPECGLAVARAMADAYGVLPDDSADVRRLEVLRDVGELGEEGLQRLARDEADALLAEEPEERRRLLDAEPERFGLPVVVDELLERCEAQWTRNAHRALELADLAVYVARRVDPAVYHDLAFQTHARAVAFRANCLRLSDDTHGAREAFRHAHRLAERVEALEAESEAEIAYLEASLALDQRRFVEAEKLLAHAAEIYQRLGKARRLALTRIKQANLQCQRGQPAEGLPALEEAARLLDLKREPQLHWTIRYNQVLYAAETGNFHRALRQYEAHRTLLESQPEPWFALRILWLRAKLARGEGDGSAAVQLYERVRDGFLEQGLGYDAAQSSLELAILHLEAGDTAAVCHLAGEMAPIFQAQDVHREALAALVLFERAARTETLTLGLARRLHRFLELARLDPTHRFENHGLNE